MKTFISLIVLLVSLSAAGQSKTLLKAEDYYNAFDYQRAIKEYKKVLKEGQHLYVPTQQIALCYSKLNDSKNAVIWYKKVIEFPEFDNNTYFLLARELQKERDYDEARHYMEQYFLKNKDLAQHKITNLDDFIYSLKKDSLRYKITPLGFNTRYDEFAPVFFRSEIVFTSNRPLSGLSNIKDVQTGDVFFHLYESNEEDLNDPNKTTLFSNNLISKYNDGPVSFSNDHTTLFLTRNTIDKDEAMSVLDIYISVWSDGEWSKDFQALYQHQNQYNVAHAFIDSRQQRIYFSSDMPGGYGGMDLYVCSVKDGFVGKPRNLGSNINTVGNELFPFISADGFLYFTSDGQPGLGGYDLFFAKPVNNGYSQAFNLEYPLNTAYDDLSLILDPRSYYGYFASNRPGGHGGDDIYGVDIKQKLDYCLVSGTVINPLDSLPVQEAWIEMESRDQGFHKTIYTDKSGHFSIFLKKGYSYELLFRKKLFQNKIESLPVDSLEIDARHLSIEMLEK